MTERRGLERVGESLDAFLRGLGMPAALDVGAVVASWDEVAGEPFSGGSRPIGLRDGVLTVGVADGGTATLLKYRLGELLSRLQAHFGTEMITAVKIRVEPPKNTP